MANDDKKKKNKALSNMVRERSLTFIVAAFSLVASLAWNEAVKSLIDTLIPSGGNSIVAKFLYAGIITLFVVLLTIYLESLFRKRAEEEE
jgi:Family of unknown function (DUF5654)